MSNHPKTIDVSGQLLNRHAVPGQICDKPRLVAVRTAASITLKKRPTMDAQVEPAPPALETAKSIASSTLAIVRRI